MCVCVTGYLCVYRLCAWTLCNLIGWSRVCLRWGVAHPYPDPMSVLAWRNICLIEWMKMRVYLYLNYYTCDPLWFVECPYSDPPYELCWRYSTINCKWVSWSVWSWRLRFTVHGSTVPPSFLCRVLISDNVLRSEGAYVDNVPNFVFVWHNPWVSDCFYEMNVCTETVLRYTTCTNYISCAYSYSPSKWVTQHRYQILNVFE